MHSGKILLQSSPTSPPPPSSQHRGWFNIYTSFLQSLAHLPLGLASSPSLLESPLGLRGTETGLGLSSRVAPVDGVKAGVAVLREGGDSGRGSRGGGEWGSGSGLRSGGSGESRALDGGSGGNDNRSGSGGGNNDNRGGGGSRNDDDRGGSGGGSAGGAGSRAATIPDGRAGNLVAGVGAVEVEEDAGVGSGVASIGRLEAVSTGNRDGTTLGNLNLGAGRVELGTTGAVYGEVGVGLVVSNDLGPDEVLALREARGESEAVLAPVLNQSLNGPLAVGVAILVELRPDLALAVGRRRSDVDGEGTLVRQVDDIVVVVIVIPSHLELQNVRKPLKIGHGGDAELTLSPALVASHLGASVKPLTLQMMSSLETSLTGLLLGGERMNSLLMELLV